MSGKNNNHEILENLKPKITFLLGIPVLKGRMLSRISPHLNQEAMSFINNLKMYLQNTAKITATYRPASFPEWHYFTHWEGPT